MSGWLPVDLDQATEILERTESQLDPAHPEAGGHIKVLGYGEISAALTTDELPGLVCKRMAGYPDDASAQAYRGHIEEYLVELRAAGLDVAPTQTVAVPRPGRPPVLYLLQPRLDPATLGNALLHTTDDAGLEAMLHAVLGSVAQLAHSNAERTDGIEVAVDGQLSNWSIPPLPDPDPAPPRPTQPDPARAHGAPPGAALPGRPVLIDVGTPFIRRDGRHTLDVEVIIAPAPPGIRGLLRRFVADSYQDDYFIPRTLAVDLLGNFHKEGAAARIPTAVAVVNDWLATTDLPGPTTPIRVDEVDAYYRTDARLLGLFLQARRADRAIRTRVLRQPYDFLLPGRVSR